MYIRGDHRIFESYKSLVVSSWNYKSLVVISWNYSFVNLQIVLKRQLWSCPWPSCNFMKLQCNFMKLHCNFMKLRCNFMKLQFRELTTCITPSRPESTRVDPSGWRKWHRIDVYWGSEGWPGSYRASVNKHHSQSTLPLLRQITQWQAESTRSLHSSACSLSSLSF